MLIKSLQIESKSWVRSVFLGQVCVSGSGQCFWVSIRDMARTFKGDRPLWKLIIMIVEAEGSELGIAV